MCGAEPRLRGLPLAAQKNQLRVLYILAKSTPSFRRTHSVSQDHVEVRLARTMEAFLIPSFPNPAVVAKTKFSMCTDEVNEALDKLGGGVRKVLIVGIETHVCVLQTTLDLLGACAVLGGWAAGCVVGTGG